MCDHGSQVTCQLEHDLLTTFMEKWRVSHCQGAHKRSNQSLLGRMWYMSRSLLYTEWTSLATRVLGNQKWKKRHGLNVHFASWINWAQLLVYDSIEIAPHMLCFAFSDRYSCIKAQWHFWCTEKFHQKIVHIMNLNNFIEPNWMITLFNDLEAYFGQKPSNK